MSGRILLFGAFAVSGLFAGATSAGADPGDLRYSWDDEPNFVNTAEGERILFSRATDGPVDGGDYSTIFSMNPDGTGAVAISNPTDGMHHGAISPSEDGFQVAYETRPETFIPDHIDSSNGFCLTGEVGGAGNVCFWAGDPPLGTANPEGFNDPALAPSGETLALIRPGGVLAVRALSRTWAPDGGAVAIGALPAPAKDPSFSASGDEVVVDVPGTTAGSGIWSVSVTGDEQLTQLTSTSGDGECYVDSEPIWRPVAETVAFVRTALPCGDSDLDGIWEIDPATGSASDPWPQGDQLVTPGTDDIDFGQLDASSLGDLTYVTERETGSGTIEQVDLYDGTAAPLSLPSTGSVSIDSAPRFSADGGTVAFARRADLADTESGIYSIDIATTAQVQLTQSYDYVEPPEDEASQADPPAELRIAVRPGRISLGSGKTRAFEVKVGKKGSRSVKGARICMSGPRKAIRFKRGCVRIGSVAGERALRKSVGLRANRPGKGTFRLRLTLRAPGAEAASAVLVVKPR